VAPVDHPTERGGKGRTWFDQAAEAASNFTSSPWFFGVCTLLVVGWIGCYVVGAPESVKVFIGSAMTAVTLFLVALIKNAERRAEHAIQQKLDALIQARYDESRGRRPDSDALEAALELHDEV
jgi:low affinity Fe/Cu permease